MIRVRIRATMIRTGSSFQNDLLFFFFFFGVPLAERLPGALAPPGAFASVPFPPPAALASAGPGGVLARGPEDDASAADACIGPPGSCGPVPFMLVPPASPVPDPARCPSGACPCPPRARVRDWSPRPSPSSVIALSLASSDGNESDDDPHSG